MAKPEGGTAVKEAGPIPEMKNQKEGVLYVGMDLGCYKTSVAATNGTRETVYSIVGWPKDPVSRKMLGKDIVFGNEAFQHRLALETVRPFEKGALKYIGDEEAGIKEGKLARYEEAAKLIRKKHPSAQFTINMVREVKERLSFVNDVNDKAVVTWPNSDGKPTPFDITNELKEACRLIVPDIVAGLHKLVSSFDAE